MLGTIMSSVGIIIAAVLLPCVMRGTRIWMRLNIGNGRVMDWVVNVELERVDPTAYIRQLVVCRPWAAAAAAS